MKTCLIIPLSFVLLSGCTYVGSRYGEVCKTHAHADVGIEDFISSRFPRGAPVRMGIVPFTVAANLAGRSSGMPSLGYTLAARLQAKVLEYQVVPIVELFNREDWPGKRDEFFSGNFGAISLARDAGYDLVLVGLLESTGSPDEAAVSAKVIDTDSGMTLWYGRASAFTRRRTWTEWGARAGVGNRQPNVYYFDEIHEELMKCLGHAMLGAK